MMYLPKPISDFLAQAEIRAECGGMSSADVYHCHALSGGKKEGYYLKVEPWSASVENEHRLYRWLYDGKRLPVPEPLFCVAAECPVDAGNSKSTEFLSAEFSSVENSAVLGRTYGYLLIRQAKGEILRQPKYYADPVRLARLAAEGLRLLWQVDTADCPVKGNLDEKLKLAQEELCHGSYGKLDASVPYTKDFKNHAEVFEFLVKHQPDVEPVFTHGDYCLNNFFTDGEHVTAFIDFGNGGVGDAYQDIALCVREFIKRCPGAIPYFYEQIGIKEIDEEKLRYYMLLDELF